MIGTHNILYEFSNSRLFFVLYKKTPFYAADLGF